MAAEQYAKYQNVLKNAVKGQVCTRFPPEPSGYLHVGHIKAAMLNYHYSKVYEGKMRLRFDDTNPSKETDEFTESIKDDLKRMEITPDAISYTSDHFAEIMTHAKKLIDNGTAYMDNTPVEQMREERMEGIESKCRSQTVEENQTLWDQFVAGENADYCVRVKIDMTCLNKCMRDPVIYRANAIPHLRTGDQYKIYPTYDFACPIVDSIEEISHAMRTNEYADRNPQYAWMQEACEVRKVDIFDFSRLNFQFTCLSKRKLQAIVDSGAVEGWNDPRFPTVQGIIRRGMLVQTLKDFMMEQGPSKNTVLMEWDKIWAKNKQTIENFAPRIVALTAENLCVLELSNGPEEPFSEERQIHPKYADMGMRPVSFANKVLLEHEDVKTLVAGEKITLMKWGNCIVETIEENTEELSYCGFPIKMRLTGHLELEDKNFKKTKKLTWLAANPDILVPVTSTSFGHLITKAKVEDADEIQDLVNKESRFDTACVSESYVTGFNQSDIIQFERKGNFIIDNATAGQPMNLFLIPDGAQKSAPKAPAKQEAPSDKPLSKKQLKKQQQKEKKAKAKAEHKKKAEEDAPTTESTS